MKRIIVFILLTLCALPVCAQTVDNVHTQKQINKDLDQLLADALKRGVKTNDRYVVYTLDNKKNKDVQSYHAIEYLRERGYIPIQTYNKEHLRYGAMRTMMDKVEFITDADFRGFALTYFSLNADFSDGTENVTFFIPKMKDSWYWGKRICNGEFRTVHNVLWTGDVVNGFANKRGSAFMPFDGGYASVRGSFIAGFPENKQYTLTVLHKDMSVSEQTVDPVSFWDIARAKKKASGELLDAMKEFARITYAENVKPVEEEYERTLALTKSYDDFKPNYEVIDQFRTVYGDWPELDTQGLLAKTDELQESYAVLNALTFEFSNYRLMNLASILYLRYFWDDVAEKNDISTISNALDIARKKGKDSQYTFKPFYAKALPILEKRDKDLQVHLDKARKAYAKYEAELREKARSYEEYKASMCDRCKINGSKTTFPKGYVEGWSFLWMTWPGESAEDGEIVMVNGEKIKWRFIYEEHSTSVEAEGDFMYKTSFDTVDEMVNSIIEQCKRKYCH